MPAPSTPADQPKKPHNNDKPSSAPAEAPKKPLPLYITDPDRWKKRPNRFNQREVERAGRAGKAIGAERVEVDPATGKISIILSSGEGGTVSPDDLLSKL